jgi:TRAP-type C4-dicarboxylate transport system substrate-binding protein
LQLGTVDAGENDPASVMSWGWNDVIKYYSLDKHSISVLPILMNKAKFDSFPPETQKAIREAGREAENYQIDYVTKAWDDSLKQIKASGVQVNEVSDLAGFQKAVAPIIDQYTAEIGADLIKKVQALATKN